MRQKAHFMTPVQDATKIQHCHCTSARSMCDRRGPAWPKKTSSKPSIRGFGNALLLQHRRQEGGNNSV